MLETILNSRVLATLIWAAIILIALYKFEKPICALIGRIKSAKGPGGTALEFELPGISLPKGADKAPKEYHTFVFGVALVWTFMQFAKASQASVVTKSLENSIEIAKRAGLDGTAESLGQIRKNLLTQTKELSIEDRKMIIDNLGEISIDAGRTLMGKGESVEK